MPAPVIVEAALNGVTTRERNPHVPRTPSEIAADALAALDAGAAIVHNHIAEMTTDGARAAAVYAEGWRPVLAARPDAILYPTVGFGPGIEERFAHMTRLAEDGLLRVGVVDAGSVNLGSIVYANAPADVAWAMAACTRLRLGPSLAVFEPGFLRAVLAYQRAGRLPAGSLVKLYFGGTESYFGGADEIPFGLPPTPASLEAYLDMLDGSGLPWSVAVLGGDVMADGFARRALERGGHLHVGLEDYAGPDTPTNEALVRAAVALVREVGRPVATCAETARLLGLPRAA